MTPQLCPDYGSTQVRLIDPEAPCTWRCKECDCIFEGEVEEDEES